MPPPAVSLIAKDQNTAVHPACVMAFNANDPSGAAGLAWWDEVQIETYLDAFRELILPQTTVLVGNHSTLWRWLLPDWHAGRAPAGRDIARAAHELGATGS